MTKKELKEKKELEELVEYYREETRTLRQRVLQLAKQVSAYKNKGRRLKRVVRAVEHSLITKR